MDNAALIYAGEDQVDCTSPSSITISQNFFYVISICLWNNSYNVSNSSNLEEYILRINGVCLCDCGTYNYYGTTTILRVLMRLRISKALSSLNSMTAVPGVFSVGEHLSKRIGTMEGRV